MPYDHRLSALEDNVAVVTLNRPQRRNAVSFEMARELEACLTGLMERKEIRVLILTGEGSAFGAGADLKERVPLTPEIVQQHPGAWSGMGFERSDAGRLRFASCEC